MNLERTLPHVARWLLIAFLVVITSLAYWALVGADALLSREDNPRRVEAERAIQRGTIFDQAGVILAESVQVGQSISGRPIMRRRYPYPDAASVVGYYSLRFGVGGVEAAYDEMLRGTQTQIDRWLHRVQVGSDLRLTIDLGLQRAITAALGRNPGAVVLVEVPSGAVRALVSLPSFDPNRLNETYDLLRLNPFAPLLNRVTQGIYQPGGALQTIALAHMLTAQLALTQEMPQATQPLQLSSLTLACAAPPNDGAQTASTLLDAYIYACPMPFVDFTMSAPGDAHDMIAAFGLLEAPTLVDFGTVAGRSPTPLTSIRDLPRLRAQAAGQGDLTVTPLQMALVAAVIANNGNTITPYLVDAVRPPGALEWQSRVTPRLERAVVTSEVAQNVRTAMRQAVVGGAARAADQPPLAIYGHASFAYTGINANSWFIGVVERPDGHLAVVAVIIEGKNNPTLAAQVGGEALRAFH
jgi:peptidoglycan glycosyltransferase